MKYKNDIAYIVENYIKDPATSKKVQKEIIEHLRRVTRFLGIEQVNNYGGKLPYVLSNSNISDEDMVTVYRLGLKDFFDHITYEKDNSIKEAKLTNTH